MCRPGLEMKSCRGMLSGLKLKWQPFSQWSGAGSKAWTSFLEQHPPGSSFVYGSGGGNKRVGLFAAKEEKAIMWQRFNKLRAVVKAKRKMLLVFHPLVSTCCSQKTFHPLRLPEAAVPLRLDPLCDLPLKSWGVLDSSQGHTGSMWTTDKTAKQNVCFWLLFANVVSFCVYHTWTRSILSRGCVFPNEWWMINCCCWFVRLL